MIAKQINRVCGKGRRFFVCQIQFNLSQNVARISKLMLEKVEITCKGGWVMKLVQFFVPELGKRVGVLQDEKVFDITEVAPSTLALLERAIDRKRSLEEEAKEALEEAKSRNAQTFEFASLQNPPLLISLTCFCPLMLLKFGEQE